MLMTSSTWIRRVRFKPRYVLKHEKKPVDLEEDRHLRTFKDVRRRSGSDLLQWRLYGIDFQQIWHSMAID